MVRQLLEEWQEAVAPAVGLPRDTLSSGLRAVTAPLSISHATIKRAWLVKGTSCVSTEPTAAMHKQLWDDPR